MGATFSRAKQWINGETLTHTDLNTEFDNILNNFTPAGMDDYSSSQAVMQTTVDPYPSGTESYATSLQGELERLRYVVKLNNGGTQWYYDPPYVFANHYASLSAAVTAIGSTVTTLIVKDTQTLTANLTIPSTLTLRVMPGGTIAKASTYTLTINGPFPDPGPIQVFSGFSAGDVTFDPTTTPFIRSIWDGNTGIMKFTNMDTYEPTFTADRLVISDGTYTTKNYADIAVVGARTTMNHHAFEDWVTITSSTTSNLGYASYDAKATLAGTVANNHFACFQARNTYTGSGGITQHLEGFSTSLVHSGSGTVATVYHFRAANMSGGGPTTTQYGLFVPPLSGATTNYGIYVSHSAANYIHTFSFETIKTNSTSCGINFGVDESGKTLVIGYGTAGTDNYGTTRIYDGKTGIVATFDGSGTTFNKAVAFQSTALLKSYAYASLPSASEGMVVFCSNGRKTGEGAGAGTGVVVYYSAGTWKRFYDDATVTA